MEKDGGRVEKQTKAKLCIGRIGGDVHAASGVVAYSLVYRDLFWGGSLAIIGGVLFLKYRIPIPFSSVGGMA